MTAAIEDFFPKFGEFLFGEAKEASDGLNPKLFKRLGFETT